jgi:D-serine deaminase-like pyridoxal phosphate-dependent protein
MILSNIKKPTLLIDRKKVEININTITAKTKKSGIIFRPHFKTHQSNEVGKIYKELGINKITVSSVGMANYFMNDGWEDITIAFPLNIRELPEIQEIASKIKLNILISSSAQLQNIDICINSPIGFFLKIDTGYHRAGIDYRMTDEIDELLKISSTNPLLSFKGFLSHFGNTYGAKNINDIIAIYHSGIQKLLALKTKYQKKYPEIIISIGDTPSTSLIEDFGKIDEIRPGNFVYYDWMQKNLGSCREEQIAVAVACPVIDINHQRNEILIYGGAVHFSKEFVIDTNRQKTFGSIVELSHTGWSESVEGCFLKSLSQEHGLIHADQAFMPKVKTGDLIGILPIHSCLTANLLKESYLII